MRPAGRSMRAPLRAVVLSASNVVRLLSQLLILPVLARLISPADYGAVGLVVPIVLAINIVSEMGLGTALVRAENGRQDVESTVWWVSVLLGLALMAAFILGAPVLRYLLGNGVPLPVFRWLGLVLLLSCVCTVPTARIQRLGQTWAFALSDLGSSLLSAAVAFWMAFHGYGVYALVGQQLAIWLIKTATLAISARFLPSFTFNIPALRMALGFGVPVSGSNLVDYFSRTVDNVVVGRVLGTASLGWYGLAYQVMRIPDAVIAGPIAFTIFPAVDRMNTDRARVAAAYLVLIEALLTLGCPLLFGLSATADAVVAILLGPKWTESGLLLAILAPAGVLQCLVPASYAILMGVGRTRLQMMLAITLASLVLAGVVAGVPFGLVGVAIGVLAGTLLGSAAVMGATARVVGIAPGRVLRTALPPIGAGLVTWCVAAVVRHALRDAAPVLQLLPAVVASALVYGVLLCAWGPALLKRVRDLRRSRTAAAAEDMGLTT